jgi:mannose-6-phosphate isomerase
VRLDAHAIAKPWGRHKLGPWGLGLDGAAAIGEIHHVANDAVDRPLLVKTLFTSERLSVQVHPDAASATARGLPRGKDEAWVVLAAEPGAKIGIGLDAALTPAALRAAALDGSLVDRLVWRPCEAGDVFFTPAGTIHAIGGGLTLFEVQQNLDVTYRLFDYGRGRRLDLDDGIAVAQTAAWQAMTPRRIAGRDLIVDCPSFTVERLHGAGWLEASVAAPAWVAVIGGAGRIDGVPMKPGEVWLAETPVALTGGAELLLIHEGHAAVRWRAA